MTDRTPGMYGGRHGRVRGVANRAYTSHDGIGDIWRCTSGVSTTGTGYMAMAVMRRDAASDYIGTVDDGSGNNTFAWWFAGTNKISYIGKVGNVARIQGSTTTTVPSGAGNEFLAQMYFGTGSSSRIYVDGSDLTSHVTQASWSGPTGADRITWGSDGGGAIPLLGRFIALAWHKGAIDAGHAYALRNRSDLWPSELGVDHCWMCGNHPADTASALHDCGVVGGWPLAAIGTPTIEYGRTIL